MVQGLPPEALLQIAIDKVREFDPELVGMIESALSQILEKAKRDTIEDHARVVRAVAEGTYRIIDQDERSLRGSGPFLVQIPSKTNLRGSAKKPPQPRSTHRSESADDDLGKLL